MCQIKAWKSEGTINIVGKCDDGEYGDLYECIQNYLKLCQLMKFQMSQQCTPTEIITTLEFSVKKSADKFWARLPRKL